MKLLTTHNRSQRAGVPEHEQFDFLQSFLQLPRLATTSVLLPIVVVGLDVSDFDPGTLTLKDTFSLAHGNT
jgi:hypothetical protein